MSVVEPRFIQRLAREVSEVDAYSANRPTRGERSRTPHLFSLYRLNDEGYGQIAQSKIPELAGLEMDMLTRCVLMGQTSRMNAANEFRKALRL